MPPTLASVVRNSSLHLTVLAGADHLERPVRWVHTSELDDPTPFLEGGELLLTTGIKLGTSTKSLQSYVHRLADAGVVGLGLGVGLSHTEVPQPLVDAAAQRGLPLLRVPEPTPFIAISKAVSAALAAEQYEAVTTSFEAQEELTRAALGQNGTAAVVRRLAARLGGWAALYDSSGALSVVAPDWAARRAARLAAEVDRLRRRPAPASAALQGRAPGFDTADEDFVVVQSLGADRRARGFLAVGTEDRITPTERYVLNAAVALLTLTLERSRELRYAEERMGAALLRLVLAGQVPTARQVATGLFGGLPEGTIRVLVAGVAPGTEREKEKGKDEAEAPVHDLTELAERAEQAGGRAGEKLLVAREQAGKDGKDGKDGVTHPERLVLLAVDGGAVHRACLGAVEEREGLALGVSAPAPVEEAGGAYAQAERALAVALRGGRRSVGHEEVGAGSLLPLLGEDAVAAFAEGLLRPLRDHDRTARGDLVASLRAWLSRHGQWDAAAADLGVHRHTLRYRMRRVEELLGRSLDDTDVRMELWLALRSGEESATL
ncbi:PucR family transcriptional regulator [Kitasatospora sp. NBC_01287]|uniref:PucR family transcriptional regulator n=1 Tax=Kitasatospora sp. NBC_01287 TaxID=2903573 RepID=UPI0022554CC8|nr:PucR family transcriptional regulator [Kitasatospora sp. NBC_01287]MCX4746422.1 PucR family transcriptional regulator [Kitasatospora sp. NBC_01287]